MGLLVVIPCATLIASVSITYISYTATSNSDDLAVAADTIAKQVHNHTWTHEKAEVLHQNGGELVLTTDESGSEIPTYYFLDGDLQYLNPM